MAITNAALENDLERIREELDKVDAELIRLLAQRVQLGVEAGAIKRAMGRSIVDAEREARVLAQAKQWAADAGLPSEEVADAVTRLISLSRGAQLRSQ